MRNSLFPALLLTFLAACGDGKRDIQAYYFPIEELADGRVYEFHSVGGTEGNPYSEYWFFRSAKTDTGTYLTGAFYDSNFQIGQIIREKIVANGSLARNLLVYEPNRRTGEMAPVEAVLEANNVFPFRVLEKDGGVFLFKLHYQLPGDSTTKIYLVRNRKFGGDAPEFEFRGKQFPAIRFSLREVVGNESIGAAEVEASGEERYAKGLGLVYFRKEYGHAAARTVREFQLVDMYPLDVLEEKARATLAK